MVWYIDPATRSAISYTGIEQATEVPSDGVLDGGEVLPGFQLSPFTLSQQADRQRP